MARRKRRSFRRYVKRSKSMLGKLNKPIIGAIGVVVYEAFVSSLIPVSGIMKNIVELLIGLFLSKKGGILGAMGTALVYINAYQIVGSVKGMVMGGSTPSISW